MSYRRYLRELLAPLRLYDLEAPSTAGAECPGRGAGQGGHLAGGAAAGEHAGGGGELGAGADHRPAGPAAGSGHADGDAEKPWLR